MSRQQRATTAVLVVAGLAWALWAAEGPADQPSGSGSAAPTAETTRLYGQYCKACHGTDGKGTAMRATMPTIPDFTSRAWQDSRSNAELLVGTLEGKGTFMPGFRDRVNDDQARDLIVYVRAPAPGGPR